MFELLLVQRSEWFQQGRFMGRILDEWSTDSQEFVRSKLPHLLVIACLGFVLIKLLRLGTARMVVVAERHAAGSTRLQEVKTLSSVIRATGLATIALIVGMQIMDALGVNLAPLLASAGVAGVAIGLAAQSLVKDMLNGITILLEGQFAVGDRVSLAGVSGTVEAMTLRKTTLKAPDGTVYVIPNSQITTVANLGMETPHPPQSPDQATVRKAAVSEDPFAAEQPPAQPPKKPA